MEEGSKKRNVQHLIIVFLLIQIGSPCKRDFFSSQPDSKKKKSRVEKIHRWCWSIDGVHGLEIQMFGRKTRSSRHSTAPWDSIVFLRLNANPS